LRIIESKTVSILVLMDSRVKTDAEYEQLFIDAAGFNPCFNG